MHVFYALAHAKGCHYSRWFNPVRLNSFFQATQHNQEQQPKEGEEMPILFRSEDWLKWMMADTIVDIGLLAVPLQKLAEKVGISLLA